MKIENTLPLINVIEQIPDPGNAQGKRHPLSAILALAIAAIICGYRSYSAISEWGKNYGKRLSQKLGFKNGKTPCSATFYNVFKKIDINVLENKIKEWTEIVLKSNNKTISSETVSNNEAISIDGKTLRGTRKQGGEIYHFLSAFSHRLGITICQCGVDKKTNEIKAIQELLENLILKGKIITMDALLTQVEVAKKIVKEEGDYVMIVKDNQQTLKEDIQCALSGEEKFGKPKIHETVEKGHGRIEHRKITVCDTVPFIDWYGDKQVFKIEREVKRKEKISTEIVYGITSLESTGCVKLRNVKENA